MRISLIAAVAAILVTGVAGLGTTAATAGSEPASVAASNAVLTYTVRAASAPADAGALAERLAHRGYDVVARDGGDISIIGPSSTARRLAAEPLVSVVGTEPYVVGDPRVAPPASQDAVLPRQLDGQTYPTFYGGYRTVDAYLDFTADVASAYPDLVRSVDYGTSWTGDDPLRAVCITADAAAGCELTPDTNKARFLIVAQTHARELTTSEITWRYLSYLVDGYGRRPQVTSVLDSTEIWLVPQVNPDGIRTVEQGIAEDGFGGDSPAWQRKNLNDSHSSSPCGGQWQSSQEGIDLNRNFAIDWGRTGTSTNPCNLTYGGPRAASEPETTAQTDLMADLFPDQRGTGDAPAPLDATGAMLTFHSYANDVLLPWGFTTEDAPNEIGLRSFGFRMSYFNGFETGQSGEILYNSSGATEDWLYDRLGVAGFTWEIGPGGGTCGGFFPPYSCQPDLWAQNRDALMYTASAAAAPYRQTLGPTTLGVRVGLTSGGAVRVRATADDDAYGDNGVDRPAAQGVTAGRLYVGTPPSQGGQPTSMAVRGSGSSVELVARFEPSAQRRLVYVQGRDADGHWGPLAAAWVPPAG